MNKKQSGVDIDLGNACSKNAYTWAKKTFANRAGKAGEPHMGVDGAFSNVLQFKDARIGISSDGIGTKIELAERTGIYHTIGHDLMAMTVDDLAANGFEATSISNIIDLDFLDYNIIDELMRGLHEAAELAGVAVTGGEIAELGPRMNGYGDRMHFNWCATAIGILPDVLQGPIDGSEIHPGDTIIALKSRGFRSNGFSLVRRVMTEKFGEDWHTAMYDDNKTWGEVLIAPSIIYTRAITGLVERNCIPTGIAHITGGGLADNLGRALKASGMGAELSNIFEPAEFVQRLQELGNITEEQAYRIWNMGNGMLVMVRPEESDAAIIHLAEMGFEAQVAGCILPEAGITIETKGCGGTTLRYTDTNK